MISSEENAGESRPAKGVCRQCGATTQAFSIEGLCGRCLGLFAFRPDTATSLRSIGGYDLIEEIARGGMGIVYKARQRSLNRFVALKVLSHGPFSDSQSVRRFQTEAEAIARLHHPNIVSIYEIGEHEGHHFIAMELVVGKNFAELTAEYPLSPALSAKYMAAVADAIAYAHGQGVIHRDLKPSNLLLDKSDQPRVTDFGLAKLSHSDISLTLTGQSLGSPGYMAPEQAFGKAKDAGVLGDIYSLGAALYHLTTGRPPFVGETPQDVLLQAQTAEPIAPRRLNPRIPMDLETICCKCLEREPGNRYASAEELAADLRRFIADEPIHASPVSKFEKSRRWACRRPALSMMTGALLVAVVVGMTGVLREWTRAERSVREMRLSQYAADISVASQAVSRGDLGVARRMLVGLEPKSGQEDLRGFEWGYLSRLCKGDQMATLTGHDWIVTCVAFSPDGSCFVTGSQDGTARIWDAKKQVLDKVLPSEGGAIWSVGFSADGNILLTAGNQREVELWDWRSGVKLFTAPGQLAALSHRGSLVAEANSSAMYWEAAGSVAVWDWKSGRKIRELATPGRAVAFSADDSELAVAGAKQGVFLYDIASGALLRELSTTNAVWSLMFSPSGSHLLAAGWCDRAFDWDLRGKAPPESITNSYGNVWCAAFSPDGTQIATANSDRTVRIWDATTLQQQAELRGHGSEVWCVAFSPDGKMLASGGKDQAVLLWSAKKPDRADSIPNDHNVRPIFSRDGSQIFVTDPKSGDDECWNTETRTRLKSVRAEEIPRPLTIDGDGMIRVSGGNDKGSVNVWQGPRPPVRCAALDTQRRHVAVAIESENWAHLYDVASHRDTRLLGHKDFVSGVAFSPDGKTLATGSMDGRIKLWDCETGLESGELPGHLQETTDVAFSPDGRTLASLGQRESIRLWHVATKRELMTIDLPLGGHYLQFSPDGKTMASTMWDDTVRFFDAR
jgi:WD40 repeat protein/serine/threonine protein kinase